MYAHEENKIERFTADDLNFWLHLARQMDKDSNGNNDGQRPNERNAQIRFDFDTNVQCIPELWLFFAFAVFSLISLVFFTSLINTKTHNIDLSVTTSSISSVHSIFFN